MYKRKCNDVIIFGLQKHFNQKGRGGRQAQRRVVKHSIGAHISHIFGLTKILIHMCNHHTIQYNIIQYHTIPYSIYSFKVDVNKI